MAPPSHDEPGARPRILLVEDDDAVRRSLQLLLVARGYDVRAYRRGSGLSNDPEALRATCLIADLLMPEGDALTLLHDLRGAGWAGPAILISGHLTDDVESRARSQGFAAVLPKPIGENVLATWVANLVSEGAEGHDR